MANPAKDVHYTYEQRMKSCGKVTCTRCRSGIPGHGPYWYAYWREGGRVHSRYLGKLAPTGIPTTAESQPSRIINVLLPGEQPSLRVRTLGEFVVWRGPEPVPAERWARQKVRGFFALLLSRSGFRLHREEVLELLWPDLDIEAAESRLWNTVRHLRKILDVPDRKGSHIRWQGDQILLLAGDDPSSDGSWLDATEFEQLATAALANRDQELCKLALSRYGGAYLPEFTYDDWAATRRRALHDQYLALLLHLADLCETHGDMHDAEAHLQTVLRLDPSHEEATARLMSLLAGSGQRTEALQVYANLAAILKRELGVVPSPDVRTLREQIVAQSRAPVAAALPPQQARPTQPTNVPYALTSFVGRNREMDEVCTMLAETRMLTLTGEGGCGKTRLSLQIGRRLVTTCADGVWLVELAATNAKDADRASVCRQIAGVLGVQEKPVEGLFVTLAGFLAPRQLLLILDNCEHLIAPCADLIAALLATCPELRVLATSRESLGVPGETVYRVPPLSVPPPAVCPEELRRYESASLFLERATAFRRHLAISRAEASAIAQICRRLDGIPLAIELAAARLGVLPLDLFARRLANGIQVLAGGPRTALPRQRTMRACVEWSHALLNPAEQALFRRLAIFASGWTAEAAELVCTGYNRQPLPGGCDGDEGTDVLDLLGNLVNKSLVRFKDRDGKARYHFLEPIRQFAEEALTAANERPLAAAAHRRWCVRLANEAEPHLMGEEQHQWANRLDVDYANLQAALAWSCAAPEYDPDREGLQIAAALRRFWDYRSRLVEGRAWFDRLFAVFGPEIGPLWARALLGAGALAKMAADWPRAQALLKDSLAVARQAGYRQGVAEALMNLACSYRTTKAYAETEAWFGECLDLARELADKRLEALVVHNMAVFAEDRGDYVRAQALYEEALSLWRSLGNTYLEVFVLRGLANIACKFGRFDRAAELVDAGLSIAQDCSAEQGIAQCLGMKARIAVARGDYACAANLFAAGLDLWYKASILVQVAGVLEDLAGLIAAVLRLPTDVAATGLALPPHNAGVWAAKLLGAADHLRIICGEVLTDEYRATWEVDVATIRQHVPEATYASAWRAGAALSLDQAVALAHRFPLSGRPVTGSGKPDPQGEGIANADVLVSVSSGSSAKQSWP